MIVNYTDILVTQIMLFKYPIKIIISSYISLYVQG